LGPPGWQIHVETSSVDKPVIAEESVDLFRQVLIDHLLHILGQHESEPIGADVAAHHVGGFR
jgi:hypothetical protein